MSTEPTEGGNAAPPGHVYALPPGRVLDGYRVVEPLGVGGMGEVYLVENVHTRKRYALKLLPPAFSRDARFDERFKIEARVMSDLDHPNIVRVHHTYFGPTDGCCFFTMDLVEGETGKGPFTLDHLMAECGGKIRDRELVRSLALQMCDALVYAHGFGGGVVHRDLKPSNVLLTRVPGAAGALRVRISDFGLAKMLGPAYLENVLARSAALSSVAGDTTGTLSDRRTELDPARMAALRTSTRSILGTYEYMSPEQKSGAETTPRTDVFALGMVLYRMLTGRRAEGAFKPPSRFGAARGWNAIVRGCLQPDPADRFRSVAEVRRRIEAMGRRHPGRLAAVASAVFAGLAATWMGWGRGCGREPRPVTAADVATSSVGPAVSVVTNASDAGTASTAHPAVAAGETNRTMPPEPGPDVVETNRPAVKPPPPRVTPAEVVEALRVQALQARERASQQGARTEGGPAWAEGESAMLDAQNAWNEKNFSVSSNRWSVALANFRTSETNAVAARGAWEQAVRHYAGLMKDLPAGDLALLEKHGGPSWTGFRDAAEKARRATNNFLSARSILTNSCARLPPAVKAAREQDRRLREEAVRKLAQATGEADALIHELKAAASGVGDSDTAILSNRHRTVVQQLAGIDRSALTPAGAAGLRQIETNLVAALAGIRVMPRAGTLRDMDLGGGLSLRMAWVPSTLSRDWREAHRGRTSFRMGSEAEESRRGDDETPHDVTLTRGYWMGQCEITRVLWERVTGETLPGAVSPDEPITGVTWKQGQAFVASLNRRVPGGGFRLPTEAEWEHACRAGTTGPHAGDPDALAWHAGNSGGWLHAVGTHQGNAWNLHDMHGNAAEWCDDLYGLLGASAVTNPSGVLGQTDRVIRGGSAKEMSIHCRSARRSFADADFSDPFLGFRIVRDGP